MELTGNIRKMETFLDRGIVDGRENVQYTLPIGNEFQNMNEQIGKTIGLSFQGEIHCIYCGRKTKTSFAQGYCYPCFTSLPQTDACIIRPELCEAHKGISRDMEWSEKNCLQDHFVYLAISSGLKVGVTKSSNLPTRWIDQGAWKAIRLAKTPNRYLAGTIEVELKKNFQDRTNWREMLKNETDKNTDLQMAKRQAIEFLPDPMKDYITMDNEEIEINYPVRVYPEKVKSINLDKNPDFQGSLVGIKGQYLIFEGGHVINIRKYAGYLIKLGME